MTCEEVRVYVNKYPWEVSRAERATVITHLQKCAACMAYVEDNEDEPPLTLKHMQLLDSMIDEDGEDSEFKEQVEDA